MSKDKVQLLILNLIIQSQLQEILHENPEYLSAIVTINKKIVEEGNDLYAEFIVTMQAGILIEYLNKVVPNLKNDPNLYNKFLLKIDEMKYSNQ